MNNIIENRQSIMGKVLFFAGVCLMPLVQTAYAEPEHSHDGKHMQRMADALQLSDKQRQALKEMHAHARDEGRELHHAMRDNHKALATLNPEVKGYKKRLLTLASRQGELVEQKVIQQGEERAKIYAILTPEQRQKFMKMKRHRKHMKDD